MNAPRPIDYLKTRMREVVAIRDGYAGAGIDDFATKLAVTSLDAEIAGLLDEIRAAEAVEAGDRTKRVVEGRLVAGSLQSGSFEILAGDELIEGRADGAAREELASVRLGEEIRAVLELPERMPGATKSEPHVVYRLRGLRRLEHAAV